MKHLTVFLYLVAHAVSGVANAQVPETGRWQDFAYTAEAVQAEAAIQYDALIAELRAEGRLDDEFSFNQRVQRIATGIIAQAIEEEPAAAAWAWEVHTTSNPGEAALCMAGGKLLFGIPYIERLALSDGELATLIGHEVAHAIAEHQREYLSEALHFSPGSRTVPLDVVMEQVDSSLSMQVNLASLSRIQESEADQLGMTLAHKAGWPPTSMVSFYRKLVVSDAPTFLRSHPTPASRLSMAVALALLWGT